jgi:DNA-binding Lrp family transcriptional regulator
MCEIACPFVPEPISFKHTNAKKNQKLGNRLSIELDAIDARILDLIQRDAALSVAEIADRVGLSSSPCWRRIKRMEEQGIITKRVTLLNAEAVGLDFQVYASVKLALPTRENLERFERAVADLPEVVDCATVTGAVDYVLKIITSDMRAYDDFLRDKILGTGLVSDVQSRIVIRNVKTTTALPLSLVSPYLPAPT